MNDGPALPLGYPIIAAEAWVTSLDQDAVKILMVLEKKDGGELITWTPLMRRFEAHGVLRDFGSPAWYNTPDVGWDPCDTIGCWAHTLRVKGALIMDQAS